MRKLLIGLISLSTLNVYASLSEEVYKETLYLKYLKSHASENKTLSTLGPVVEDIDLYIDSLWDLAHDSIDGKARVKKTLKYLNFDQLSEYNKWRYAVLKNFTGQKLNAHEYLVLKVQNEDDIRTDKRTVYFLAGQIPALKKMKLMNSFIELESNKLATTLPENKHVEDLFHNTPDLSMYQNGEYAKSIKLFAFCRNNRLHPCLMVVKDHTNNPMRNEDGSLWSQPTLGSSKYGLPYHERNGNTPMGVYTIDAVMPFADQQTSFGKFRRLVLNFIPQSTNEEDILALLPESAKDADWWRQSVIGRDIGRNFLRIHGTGKINTDPNSPFFPLVQTSGCMAKRENTYNGVTFQDQRELLDQLMKGLELEPTYTNEDAIKGILYVINIDNKEAAVTLNDLEQFGIK